MRLDIPSDEPTLTRSAMFDAKANVQKRRMPSSDRHSIIPMELCTRFETPDKCILEHPV